jgi:hypothetical protein
MASPVKLLDGRGETDVLRRFARASSRFAFELLLRDGFGGISASSSNGFDMVV